MNRTRSLRLKTLGVENRRRFIIISPIHYPTATTKQKTISNYLFTNKTNENSELQPITTVSVYRVIPKIDLETEHVLIGVNNRSRICMTHFPKSGAGFRPHVSSALAFHFDPVGKPH